MYLIIMLFQLLLLFSDVNAALNSNSSFVFSDKNLKLIYLTGNEEWVKIDKIVENIIYKNKETIIYSCNTESFLHKNNVFYINSEFFFGKISKKNKVFSRKWKLSFRENSTFYYLQYSMGNLIFFYKGSGIHSNKKRTRFINKGAEFKFDQR